MSVIYLQNVLRLRGTKKPVKAIIVSRELFNALFQAADLRPKRHAWPAPAENACRKVIDAWLRTEGLPPSAELPCVSWHLVWHAGAKVVRDVDIGLNLNAEGPGLLRLSRG